MFKTEVKSTGNGQGGRKWVGLRQGPFNEQSWHEQARSLHRGLQEVQITLAARLGEAEEKIKVLHSGMYVAHGPGPHTAPWPYQTRRRKRGTDTMNIGPGVSESRG